jgi:hypothetical protein
MIEASLNNSVVSLKNCEDYALIGWFAGLKDDEFR